MHLHAHIALGAALAFILGCKGGSGAPIDSDFWQDAAVDGSVVCHCSCNPVLQAGCETGEKCGTLVESIDPFLARTTCVPDGSVGLGGACVRGAASAAMGYDDCIAGLDCLSGLCARICAKGQPDSCRNEDEAFGEGEYCGPQRHFSADYVGVCTPGCDPLNDSESSGTVANSDCNVGQACALDAINSSAICIDTSTQAQQLLPSFTRQSTSDQRHRHRSLPRLR